MVPGENNFRVDFLDTMLLQFAKHMSGIKCQTLFDQDVFNQGALPDGSVS
jgi:hypothetical protein